MKLELILTAFAAMKATDLFKQLLPWPPAAWVRSVVSLAAVCLCGVLVEPRGADLILFLAGAWGLSAAFHEVTALLSMAADNFKAEVILKAAGRRR